MKGRRELDVEMATSCLVFTVVSAAASSCLEFGSWGSWSDCSKTCGLGQHIRFRPRQAMLNGKCVRLSRAQAAALPPALSADGGSAGSAKLVQRKQCKVITCAAAAKAAEKAHKRSQRSDCQVGPWSKWGPCSKACGTGVRRRTRRVLQAPQGGGKSCPLVYEAQPCLLRRCGRAPAGGWRGKWELRHDTHGDRYWHDRATGSNTYSPPPGMFSLAAWRRYDSQVQQHLQANGVLLHPGAIFGRQNTGATASTTCVLGAAVPASKCSRSCGQGTQRYVRDAMRLPFSPPASSSAALRPRADGTCQALHSMRPCNMQPCPLDCDFGMWGQWSLCSRVCGGGVRSRSRTVHKVEAFGGKPCPALRQIARCSTEGCGTLGSSSGAGSRGSSGLGEAFMDAIEAQIVSPSSLSPTPRPSTAAPTPRPTPAPQRFTRVPTPSPVPGWRDDWAYTGPSFALTKGALFADRKGHDSTTSAGAHSASEHGSWRAQLGISPPLQLQRLTIPWAHDQHKSIAHAWTQTTSTETVNLRLLRCSSIHVGPMPQRPAWKHRMLQKTGVASYAGTYKLTSTTSNGRHVWQYAVASGTGSAMGPARYLYSYLHPIHGWMWVIGYRLGKWGPNTWAEDQLAIRAPSTSLLPPVDIETSFGAHSAVTVSDDDADMGQEYLTEKDASQAHPVWAVWHGIGAMSGTMALPELHVRCTGPRPPTRSPTRTPTPAPTATPTHAPTAAPTQAGTTLPWALVPKLQAVAVNSDTDTYARHDEQSRATLNAAEHRGDRATWISVSLTMKLVLALTAVVVGALIALMLPSSDTPAVTTTETSATMPRSPGNCSSADALALDNRARGEAEQRPLRQLVQVQVPLSLPRAANHDGVDIRVLAQAWQT